MGTYKDIIWSKGIQKMREEAIEEGLPRSKQLKLIKSHETLKALYMSKRNQVNSLEQELVATRAGLSHQEPAVVVMPPPVSDLPLPDEIPVAYVGPRGGTESRTCQCLKLYGHQADPRCPCPPNQCFYTRQVKRIKGGLPVVTMNKFLGYDPRD